MPSGVRPASSRSRACEACSKIAVGHAERADRDGEAVAGEQLPGRRRRSRRATDVLLDGDDRAAALGEVEDQPLVERLDEAGVDDRGADAVGGEQVGGALGGEHHRADGEDRDVVALAQRSRPGRSGAACSGVVDRHADAGAARVAHRDRAGRRAPSRSSSMWRSSFSSFGAMIVMFGRQRR